MPHCGENGPYVIDLSANFVDLSKEIIVIATRKISEEDRVPWKEIHQKSFTEILTRTSCHCSVNLNKNKNHNFLHAKVTVYAMPNLRWGF